MGQMAARTRKGRLRIAIRQADQPVSFANNGEDPAEKPASLLPVGARPLFSDARPVVEDGAPPASLQAAPDEFSFR